MKNKMWFKWQSIIVIVPLLILSFFPAPQSVLSSTTATYVVTKTEDTNDGVCDSDCSLREAIVSANNNIGADQIVIPAGIYTITIAGTGENAAATGDFDIIEDVTITGADTMSTIIDGNQLDRLFHVQANTTVTISNLTVMNGAAPINDPHGGGIANGGNLTLSNLIIKENTAYGGTGISQGGGVNNYGYLLINNCAIVGNYAEGKQNGGGGIGTSGTGTTIITNSTISGNTTNGGGGGIFNTGSLTVKSSTLVENQALSGGGLFTTYATFGNSIVGNNTASTYNNCDVYFSITSSGYNLESGDSCEFHNTGDQINTDPVIGSLEDNGGSTLTHALLTDSPAIDAGNPLDFPDTDQRGVTRPQGSNPDIGAFEYYLLSPSLTVNYDIGSPGSYFLITGDNFPADQQATLTINGHIITNDIAVDSGGSVMFRLSTDQADEGVYFVTVSVNPSASTLFMLDNNAPLRELSGEGDIIAIPAGIAYQLVYLPIVNK